MFNDSETGTDICRCRFARHTKGDHKQSPNHRVRNGDEQSSEFTQTSQDHHDQTSHLYNSSTSNLKQKEDHQIKQGPVNIYIFKSRLIKLRKSRVLTMIGMCLSFKKVNDIH